MEPGNSQQLLHVKKMESPAYFSVRLKSYYIGLSDPWGHKRLTFIDQTLKTLRQTFYNT
jgi:hypothetical protein